MKLKSLLSLALLCMAAPTAFGQAASMKVAVVNPGQVINGMKETQDFQAGAEAERGRLKAQEDERRAELQKLQSQRDQLKSDSPQWEELNSKLADAIADFQAWGQKTKIKVERAQKRQFVQLFDRMEQAVAEVAKRDGYDVVITSQRPEFTNLDQVPADQLRQILQSRSVWFAAAKSDISDAVIQQVNAMYKSKGGAAAPTAAPAPAPAAKKPAPAPGPAPKTE